MQGTTKVKLAFYGRLSAILYNDISLLFSLADESREMTRHSQYLFTLYSYKTGSLTVIVCRRSFITKSRHVGSEHPLGIH